LLRNIVDPALVASEDFQLDWRNISISLIEAQKGEQKAHACAIVFSILVENAV